jgi:hypothetical protein
MLRGTAVGELPQLKSCRLKGGELIYICIDQQSGEWLIRAIYNHRLGSGARLKTSADRNLPNPFKVALRTRDKAALTQDELLTWIKNLNPGLHTEKWGNGTPTRSDDRTGAADAREETPPSTKSTSADQGDLSEGNLL